MESTRYTAIHQRFIDDAVPMDAFVKYEGKNSLVSRIHLKKNKSKCTFEFVRSTFSILLCRDGN